MLPCCGGSPSCGSPGTLLTASTSCPCNARSAAARSDGYQHPAEMHCQALTLVFRQMNNHAPSCGSPGTLLTASTPRRPYEMRMDATHFHAEMTHLVQQELSRSGFLGPVPRAELPPLGKADLVVCLRVQLCSLHPGLAVQGCSASALRSC